jgi:hypothetical protein
MMGDTNERYTIKEKKEIVLFACLTPMDFFLRGRIRPRTTDDLKESIRAAATTNITLHTSDRAGCSACPYVTGLNSKR